MDVYKGRADPITVYIEETHAADEWCVNTIEENIIENDSTCHRPIGSRICYVPPKCDGDRLRTAHDFVKNTRYRVPLLIDPVARNIVHGQVVSISLIR